MTKTFWLLGLLLATTSLHATTLSSHSLFSEHFVDKETAERAITLVGIPKASLKLSGKGTVQMVIHDQAQGVANRHSCTVDGSTVCELWDGHSAHFGSSNIKKITFAATPSAVGGLSVVIEGESQEEISPASVGHLQNDLQASRAQAPAAKAPAAHTPAGLILQETAAQAPAHQAFAAQIASTPRNHRAIINWNTEDETYSWDNLFAEYTLETELGHGSFGKVFLGRNLETGQEVAIKQVYKAQCIEGNMQSHQENEIKVMQRLPQHPSICRFYKHFDMQDIVTFLNSDFHGDGEVWRQKCQRGIHRFAGD